jgi:hypothetical protein
MVIDLLSIPAQSADAERLFSSAKLMITTLCNRLSMETLQWLEQLKSWLGMEYENNELIRELLRQESVF